VLVVLLLACDAGSGETPDNPARLVKEIIVRPGGSEIGRRYWIYDPLLFEWRPYVYDQWPPYGTVRTLVTVVASAADRSGGPTELASAAAAESTVVALFAGGNGSSGEAGTRDAVLFSAGNVVEPNLQMVEARIGHTMSTLAGQRILIAGGYTPGPPSVPKASAEIFTLSGRSFALTGPMRTARGSHAAATLADGRVLIAGGLVLDGAGPATIDDRSSEIYDPATGEFTDGPDLTVARFNHSAVTLNDGRVLVIGGQRLRSAEVYDPTANTFTAVEDMAEVHGLGHQSVKLANGKVLVLGGDAGTIQPTAAAELFDPATNQFTSVGPMTAARMQHFAVLMDDGRVLIGGGRGQDGSDLATAEIYDPTSNAFSPTGDLPGATSDSPAAFVIGGTPP
jgi:hypothetical protein